MWRAFGQSTSRAAVVMQLPKEGSAEGLHVMLSPVAYFNEKQVEGQLHTVISNIKKNIDYLTSIGRNRVKDLIFFTLVSATVSIKHAAFNEEKEWRVIYLP
jgi:hypothetical protein